jgi:hypothetical protein
MYASANRESVNSFAELIKEITSLPAVDAVEVRHAYWNDQNCSACGIDVVDGLDAQKWDYWFPPYCPHCGAKMDGKKDIYGE